MSFSVALVKFHWFGTCFFSNQNAKIVACILLFSEIALQTKSGKYFQIWLFPPIFLGKKWRRSGHAHASYPGLFFSPARVQPLYVAGGKESSRTGLYYSLFVPPNFAKSIVSSFSWDLQWSQEKTKAMLMQNLGGQTKSIMLFSGMANNGCEGD